MKPFLSLGQILRGSKKPKGPETPASFLGSKATTLAAVAAGLGIMTLLGIGIRIGFEFAAVH
jgi:hypothetical protein